MTVLSEAHLAKVPGYVRDISERLKDAGYRAWAVGGCSRDLLMGREVHDWDLATDAQPHEVTKLFRKVIPTGVAHGTVTVMKGREACEITTLRGEGPYTDGRHPDHVFFVRDLEADLARRDFTVNAIAFDPWTGVIDDPFGGRADLAAGILRAVGEPAERFREDGLRIMRAARFSATLAFDIEASTLDGMREAVGTLACVSAERVRDELVKILRSKHPSRGLEVLSHCGAMPNVLKVSFRKWPTAVPSGWTELLRWVDEVDADWRARLVVLLAGLGAAGEATKGECRAQVEALRLSTDEQRWVVHRSEQLGTDGWVLSSPVEVRRWMHAVTVEATEDVLKMWAAKARVEGDVGKAARVLAVGGMVRDELASGVATKIGELKIGGRDLMNELAIGPGPVVGQVLGFLLERVLDAPELNERGRLLELARGYVLERGRLQRD